MTTINNEFDLATLQKQVHYQLSDSRYQHCLRTSERAVQLAKLNHYDLQKAQIAGLVHDYAKERSDADFIAMIKQEKLDPELLNYGNAIWHGVVGAFFIKYELKITDEDILNSVRRHTTGDVRMTTLDKIVFMADYTEPKRDFTGVEQAREITNQDLDAGVAYQLQHTLEFLLQKHSQIYPLTIASYNQWVAQK
ncbi:bis(5'-nucleosyl)-tetraphosphatase (symmetrical) YqeK [Bombilactobacillus bombi]|uniref:bis(5'-nucleosyl)-tetraphosphatase (symmetrical) YqeK n=1 Tax=Bombilactobacillus bombi TaxID=1303590 RepID=UPI0015E59F0A|nr:bis(5'-nucleosyl)-tetraphosphatase (symmetrical) YqeK [Bombilactobacillus bombi]MBA1434629.1 HD domain-containing protein [Bombilactobacillus bombi]